MWMNLPLMLFLFIKYSGTPAVGNNLVSGKKGGNVTLSCESEDREITRMVLRRLSKYMLVCESGKCESENDRVSGSVEGQCDVIIKDLIYSDAGKYILRVRYTNDQSEEERREHHLHIYDEISVKKGEDLKLDVLLINAYKVERYSSSECTELWTRGHGVNKDRLFTVNDTGTYRVLDSEGKTLITVTVTESRTGSGSPGERKDDTEHPPAYWFCRVGLPVLLVLALVGVIVFVIKKHQCLRRLYSSPPDQNLGL